MEHAVTVGLVVVDENGRRSEPHPLKAATLVGFDPSVDVRVEDPSVGDRHLLLTRLEDQGIELVDMGAGGTKLNGQTLPVGSRLRVGAGDTIELGGTTLELVRLERGPGPASDDADGAETKLAPEWGVDWGEDPRHRRRSSGNERNLSWVMPAAIGVVMIYFVLTYAVPAAIGTVTKPLEGVFGPEPKRPLAPLTPRPIPEDQKTYDPMYVPPVPEERPLPDDPNPDQATPLKAPAWLRAVFGRAVTPAEAKQAGQRSGEGLVVWVLTQSVVYERWLDHEQRALGLTGTHQVRDVKRLVDGLRKRALSPLQAVRALASDKAWSQRHLGPSAFAEAVVSRLLGADPAKLNATRQAIQEVYEGRPTQVFGEVAKDPQQVIAQALADPRAREALVQRAWTRVRGDAPAAGVLESAASQVEGRPHDLFRLMVEWARDG